MARNLIELILIKFDSAELLSINVNLVQFNLG